MNPISVLGKYLDQPRFVARFTDAIPLILIAGGSAYALNNIRRCPKEERKNSLIKDTFVLAGTISSTLIAIRGVGAIKVGEKVIFKGFRGLSHVHNHVHETHQGHCCEHFENPSEMVDEFLHKNQVSQKTRELLIKAKTKILNFAEIKTIFEELEKNPKAKEFLSGENGLIPDPENIDSKHIFGEIKRLSLLGLAPILGGISGGIIGDKLTEKDWKEKIPNKIKEGSYQYLANIFLCNVGAGVALWAMEKAKITSKALRALGMIAGIILTGIAGGSAIANLIGKRFIDPLLGNKNKDKNLYSERKPEVIDVGLHVDDIAVVAVISGLKWIEPALPILYSISGYRAGIGYRNGSEK